MTPKPNYDTLTKQELIRLLKQRDAILASTGALLSRLRKQWAEHQQIVGLFDGMGSLTNKK